MTVILTCISMGHVDIWPVLMRLVDVKGDAIEPFQGGDERFGQHEIVANHCDTDRLRPIYHGQPPRTEWWRDCQIPFICR